MNASALALEMLVMFLLMLLGYYAYRRNLVNDHSVKAVSKLVTNLCAPGMVLSAAIGREGRLDPAVFGGALGISLAIYGLLIVSGLLICLLLRVPKEERYVYHLPTVFGNIGFIGYPVCLAVLGSDSLIYAAVCNLVYNLLIYTYGRQMLARVAGLKADTGEKRGLWETVRPMINVGTLSSIVALVIYLTDPPVPEVLADTLSYAGNATVFLSMLVVGCSLAASPLKELIFGDRKIYLYLVLRMLALPILLVLLLKLFVQDALLLGTMAVLVSLPAGSMPLMFCHEIGLEGRELSRVIILSTAVCVVTIPLVCLCL